MVMKPLQGRRALAGGTDATLPARHTLWRRSRGVVLDRGGMAAETARKRVTRPAGRRRLPRRWAGGTTRRVASSAAPAAESCARRTCGRTAQPRLPGPRRWGDEIGSLAAPAARLGRESVDTAPIFGRRPWGLCRPPFDADPFIATRAVVQAETGRGQEEGKPAECRGSRRGSSPRTSRPGRPAAAQVSVQWAIFPPGRKIRTWSRHFDGLLDVGVHKEPPVLCSPHGGDQEDHTAGRFG